jgi:hypothetical protein
VDENVGWHGKIAQDAFFDMTGAAVDKLEANRKYTESLLQNVNDNIADLQNKLKQANDAYQAATAKYADAVREQYSRIAATDQLRIHIKHNILFYMQAIWAHEPPDQRFFRLYKKQVSCPRPSQDCQVIAKGKKVGGQGNQFQLTIKMLDCKPTISDQMVDLVEIADIDSPLGYKGNYIIFPLKSVCYLTTYMLQEFIGAEFGLKDPDPFTRWRALGSIDAVARAVRAELASLDRGSVAWQDVVNRFAAYVAETQGTLDEVIIPTGQLFIEALPGSHPLLEDFKLLHRAEDVRKVKAEVRHAELENLRLASRLVAAQVDMKNAAMLEDPDIEKKVIVEGNAQVSVDS